MCREDARVSNSKMKYGISLIVHKEILELPASSVAEVKIFLTAAVQPWNKWQHDENGLLLLGRSCGGLALPLHGAGLAVSTITDRVGMLDKHQIWEAWDLWAGIWGLWWKNACGREMFIVLASARLHFQESAVSAAWKRTGHLGIKRLSNSYSVSTFSGRI